MSARLQRTSLIALAITILASFASAAELRVAGVFTDHAVLQREMPVPLWGWSTPGEAVQVEFAGQTKSATADASGKWQLRLDPLAASAEGRTLTIKSASDSLTLNDVLVGEVWLGSGQSNMAMTVNRAKNFEQEEAAAKYPAIRMFTEQSTAAAAASTNAKGEWTVCSPESVARFSATAFFFGRELHQKLGVPIGLINSSVGGTPIESWISPEAQRSAPELKPFFDAAEKEAAAFDPVAAKEKYERDLARWQEASAKAKTAGKAAPRRPQDPIALQARKGNVGGLFNGKIAPLVPFAIRGVIWYQGEANSTPAKSSLYQHQLPLLVRDWRARWNAELPFAWVQLPNFTGAGREWPVVREAMLQSLAAPKTGMAITIDVGEASDIHPKDKQTVGYRLAQWVLADVYRIPGVVASGPLPKGHEIRGGEVVLSFRYADGGLTARDGDLKGFTIAGEDRVFHAARARIDGDKVVVSHPDAKSPAAVRYAWENNPDCNLYNKAGLPASPFRTDSWPLREAQ